MSKIHYFQRYSSPENTVTNNTLQLLARIYAYSPTKASQLLTELTGESIEIGLEINQQESGESSVPDGTVIQRSFKILLESKLNASPDVGQLFRHMESFSGESQKILLVLTTRRIGALEDDIRYQISQHQPDVIFRNITYEGVCETVGDLFQEYEYEMQFLVQDYLEYCNDSGLFDQSRYLMRIVPCGQSLDINKKHGIYFHPSDRGYTRHQFVGIYKDKSVQAIWEIDCVFDIDLDGGTLNKTLVQGRNTDEYDGKLIATIQDALEECGYEIETGHRFFCGKSIETDYQKSSPGGIQGARFVNLHEVLGEFDEVSDAAEKLRELRWA